MTRRGRREPARLGRMVPRVLSELGLEGAAAVLRIAEHWEEAVGPEVAAHCRPAVLRGRVLEATVDSSVWAQQIQLRRREILGRLRERLQDDAPDDLRLRVG